MKLKEETLSLHSTELTQLWINFAEPSKNGTPSLMLSTMLNPLMVKILL